MAAELYSTGYQAMRRRYPTVVRESGGIVTMYLIPRVKSTKKTIGMLKSKLFQFLVERSIIR